MSRKVALSIGVRLEKLSSSGRSALGALAALTLRGSGSLMGLAIFALAARAMPPEEFGRLAIWFSALSFLSVAAGLGQETLISRLWGEYCGAGDQGAARAAYRAGWRITLLSGASVAAALLLIGHLSGARFETLTAAAAFLFMQTQLLYSSSATRVAVGFLMAEINRDVVWRFILLIAVGYGAWRGEMTIASFFLAAAGGMVPALAFQLVATRQRIAAFPDASAAELGPMRARATAMWISAIVEAATQHVDVALVGLVASAAVAGEYFAALRIANVFLMLTSGLGAYVAAHGANLYFAQRHAELQNVFRTVSLVAFALAAPLLILIILFGPQLLRLFGEAYSASYPTLIVLSVATFVVAMCGLAPGVLLVTGLERLYARIVVVATTLRVLLSATLAVVFGALGAAFGLALVAIPMSVLLVALCRHWRRLDPSIYSLVSSPP